MPRRIEVAEEWSAVISLDEDGGYLIEILEDGRLFARRYAYTLWGARRLARRRIRELRRAAARRRDPWRETVV